MYRELEDKIYMEQFEDPSVEFKIDDFEFYPQLVKYFHQQRLYSINQNML